MPVNNKFTLPEGSKNPMDNFPLTVVRSRTALCDVIRNWRYSGHTIGFVPTMGALHNGHLSLLRESRGRADKTIASIFVNPSQFAPGEDFDTYPRYERDDLEKLAGAGCDLAYLPTLKDVYPDGNLTKVSVPGLSDLLDGQHRPHFFYGVATVVARLFIHVQPDYAIFGQKDFQQLQIIRRMVTDLGFPIEIIGGETQRAFDGLAESSRNLYLTPDERAAAGALYAALTRARVRLMVGANIRDVMNEATSLLTAAGFQRVDYVSAVAADTLEALNNDRATWPTQTRLLGAAWMGKTRLIDNIALT